MPFIIINFIDNFKVCHSLFNKVWIGLGGEVYIKPLHFLITLHQIIHFRQDNILIRNNDSVKTLNCIISHVCESITVLLKAIAGG